MTGALVLVFVLASFRAIAQQLSREVEIGQVGCDRAELSRGFQSSSASLQWLTKHKTPCRYAPPTAQNDTQHSR